MSFEVRCFIVPSTGSLVIVDAGPPGNTGAIESAIVQLGAAWTDVSDIVLTHGHFDHTGSLAEVADLAPRARLWAGGADVAEIGVVVDRVVQALVEGDRVGDLTVLATPGHTRGHISLLLDRASLLLTGDLVGSVDGALSFGPAAFTWNLGLSRQSLARLPDLGADRVLFSHGAEVPDPNIAIRRLLGASG